MRYPNWPARLEKFVQANHKRPFEYGKWDCCLFVAAAIEAMTGTHPAPEIIGAYDSESSAVEFIGTLTPGGSLSGAIASIMERSGYKEVPCLNAQRGDVIALTDWASATLDTLVCVVWLDGVRTVGVNGFLKMTLHDLVNFGARAWRIA